MLSRDEKWVIIKNIHKSSAGIFQVFGGVFVTANSCVFWWSVAKVEKKTATTTPHHAPVCSTDLLSV